MAKNKEMGNVPNLRFKGFEGEWKIFTLEEIGEFKNGINKGSQDFGFGVPFVNLMDVFGKPIISSNDNFGLVNANNKEIELYELKKGDVLFIRSSVKKTGVGETSLLTIDLPKTVYSGFLIRFRDNKMSLNLNFKRYCFYTNRFRNNLISLSSTSANTNINQDSLNSLNLFVPVPSEQTKVSTFLSTVDERISTQSKIIRELKSLKSIVSKQIFTQQLKFKDSNGEHFPDFQSGKLADISVINMGQSPSSNSYNTEKIGIPLIQGNADILNRVTNPRNWTTETTKTCKIGDLILTVRAPVGAVAKCTHDACIGRGVCAISEISDNSLEFIYQFLLEYENKWGAIEQGSTFTAVSGEEIKKIKLGIPCIQEQIKIGKILSKMDKEIQTEHKVLQQFEKQKQYLLSNLFI